MSKPKSAQQKINAGDPRRQGVHVLDRLAAAEPKVERGLPPCPARLKGDAAAIYNHFREQLESSGLAAKCDAFALERACANLATVWKCDRVLARQGAVCRIPILAGIGKARRVVGHREAKSKWLSIRTEAEKAFCRFAGAFGLVGPSSRAGLEVNSMKGAHDELMRLLMTPRRAPFKPDPPQYFSRVDSRRNRPRLDWSTSDPTPDLGQPKPVRCRPNEDEWRRLRPRQNRKSIRFSCE